MEKIRIIKLDSVEGGIVVISAITCSFPEHTHAYYEMTLYEPFNGKLYINGKMVEPNGYTAVLHSPSNFHRTEILGECNSKYIMVGFDGSVLAKNTAPKDTFIITGLEEDDVLCGLYREILNNIADKAYSAALIGAVVAIFLKKGERSSRQQISGGYKLAVGALEILNERFESNLNLNSVANELGITPQYLSKIFVENTGMNFSQYLNNIRIRHAETLVSTTKKSITQICFESGFSDFSHFLRCFKAEYGLSPKQYRNTCKKIN